MAVILSNILEIVDRSIFDAIYQVALDNGYTPPLNLDLTQYNAARTSIAMNKGFAIELFGNGGIQTRDVEKVPRIAYNSTRIIPGQLGGAPDKIFTRRASNFDMFDAEILPPHTSTYLVEIHLVSNLAKQERVLNSIIAAALPNKSYIAFYNNPDEYFLIEHYNYRQDEDDEHGITRNIYLFQIPDLFEVDSIKRFEDIAAIKTIKIDSVGLYLRADRGLLEIPKTLLSITTNPVNVIEAIPRLVGAAITSLVSDIPEATVVIMQLVDPEGLTHVAGWSGSDLTSIQSNANIDTTGYYAKVMLDVPPPAGDFTLTWYMPAMAPLLIAMYDFGAEMDDQDLFTLPWWGFYFEYDSDNEWWGISGRDNVFGDNDGDEVWSTGSNFQPGWYRVRREGNVIYYDQSDDNVAWDNMYATWQDPIEADYLWFATNQPGVVVEDITFEAPVPEPSGFSNLHYFQGTDASEITVTASMPDDGGWYAKAMMDDPLPSAYDLRWRVPNDTDKVLVAFLDTDQDLGAGTDFLANFEIGVYDGISHQFRFMGDNKILYVNTWDGAGGMDHEIDIPAGHTHFRVVNSLGYQYFIESSPDGVNWEYLWDDWPATAPYIWVAGGNRGAVLQDISVTAI